LCEIDKIKEDIERERCQSGEDVSSEERTDRKRNLRYEKKG